MKKTSAMLFVCAFVFTTSFYVGTPQAHATVTQIFLTSGSSWTVPSDWNSGSNTIEAIGGGSGGWTSGNGGGGGAYAAIANLVLTPDANISYAIGAGGTGGNPPTYGEDTWFDTTGILFAIGGGNDGMEEFDFEETYGGFASHSVGSTTYDGGGALDFGDGHGASGGGSAASPTGAGFWGAESDQVAAFSRSSGGGGGGGTGATGVAAGDATPSDMTIGGAGGNGDGGSGGGTAGANASNGGAGSHGGGGGGGGQGNTTGGAGGAGIDWDATHGAGGGGGGGGSGTSVGGNGGLYGAAGGGGFTTGGNGAQGIIVITYTPAVSPTCTLSASRALIPSGATVALTWTTANSPTSATIDNSVGSVSTSGGTTDIMPSSTTTYTLSVSNGAGSDTCTATVTLDGDKIVFLTSGTSWAVPSDWNNASNTVEAIGSGDTDQPNGGTGGGAYAKKSNVSLTPGGSASYQVGYAIYGTGNGTDLDTWFSSTGTVLAKGARSSSGGSATSSIGDVTYSGGNGSEGGGGAAGPFGAGGDAPGANANGGDADAGHGGVGDIASVSYGGNGGNGTEWDALHGSGGGGSGGTDGCEGGSGGNYGGGAGCTADGGGGTGGPGLVVITYTPFIPSAPTVITSAAESFSPTTASLFGDITATGGADATQSGFAYSTNSALASGVSTTTLGAQTGVVPFSGSLTGLSTDTTYYYRAYATNTGGTGFGSILSFLTGNTTPARHIRLFEGAKLKLLNGTTKLY